jgi:4-aminobutyrate aminotransferase/(S)-3-amino-2-methylpropionate transaminase
MNDTPGKQMPLMATSIPGPRSEALVDVLARHECPGITFRRARAGEARGVGKDPIVWDRGLGANIWDVDGNRFVDLSAGFGVALVGHRHPEVEKAVTTQAGRLIHAMGDVYPNAPRIELMAKLADMAPGNLSQSILAGGGSEAVEAALKTARLKTGRSGVIAFWGSYHGLSYGALAATAYKDDFRRPFLNQMGRHVTHMPYGEDLNQLTRFLAGPATGSEDIGAILVEPILGRGGNVVPPDAWLQGLRQLADQHDLCLIFDEIYTGCGRTGSWWAGDHAGVIPDILVVGKALGGGMPLGACIATPEVMAGWGTSQGEAIHTATFLGHPMCAAGALASLNVLQEMNAPQRAREMEETIRPRFASRLRGRGAMLGIELPDAAVTARLAGHMLKNGYIVLPSGVEGNVLSLTPPLVITDAQLTGALDTLQAGIDHEGIG